MRIGVTGWSAHLPDLPAGTQLAGWAPGAACPPERAAELVGRKGLRYKEPATRLALCAVHRALDLPAGARRGERSDPDPATAVVVSSNLGNVGTVAAVASGLRREGVRAVSPLDAPNVSSNVIASTVAIWFGYGGPNLTVCSGHPSGLDAVALARLLLTAGRATRAVVVGAEPDDGVAVGLLAAAGPGPTLCRASACVVLEAAAAGAAVQLGPVLPAAATHPGADRPGTLLLAPGHAGQGAAAVDLTARTGQAYGALGVLQVAVAAAVLADRGGTARVVCGDPADGYRTARLSSGRAA